MDPFTQRMLEKAEHRSRVLGISSASKFPLSECVNTASSEANVGAASLEHTKRSQQKHEQNKPLPASTAQATTYASKNMGTSNKQLQVVEKKANDAMVATNTGGSPNKVLRQFSAVNKENVDLGIEINIMMDKNVEVEVHVEEQDTTDGENDNARIEGGQEKCARDATNQPLARIRDASRNRLQRLGALYSKPDDLSSPIHRTEAKFSAEDDTVGDRAAGCALQKPKQRYVKLAALADSINQWEDDTIHHSAPTTTACNVPPPKPDLPSRRLAQQQKQQSPEITEVVPEAPSLTKQIQSTSVETSIMASKNDTSTDSSARNKTKQLKWDPKVINSLEAQGFQRRESNTAAKLAYEYATNEDREYEEVNRQQELESESYEREQEKPDAPNKSAVSKLTPPEIFNSAHVEKKIQNPSERMPPSVKQGLVSGRAAVFENKAAAAAAALNQQQQRPQKDPTELPLKERMLLFEKNKGSALLPKAALGMAPPINKIRHENAPKKETPKAPLISCPTSVKPSVESSVRDKVAALVASSSTISENKIIADINKQRQEDMQILANRFVKQREAFRSDPESQNEDKETKLIDAKPSSKTKGPYSGSDSLIKSSASVRPSPPPPPPPLPKVKTNSTAGALLSAKRRSPGDIIDETKRARKTSIDAIDSSANERLYPMLPDLQSNESYTCGTTATPASSECNAGEDGDGLKSATGGNSEHKEQDDDRNCHDSYMNSEDDDDDLGNNSLGREVLQVVRSNHQNRNKKQQHQHHNVSKVKGVHYSEKDRFYGADSSLNSSEASMGVDDYLDEALDEKNDDGDDDYTQESEEDDEEINKTRRGSQGTAASNSFTFRKTPKRFSNCQTISEEVDDYHVPTTSSSSFTVTQPVTSELSVNQEEDNVVTLVHTVSFYRKQQTANSNNSTPVRRICREQKVLRSTPSNGNVCNTDLNFSHTRNESSQNQFEEILSEGGEDLISDAESEDEHDAHLVQEKIKKHLDEVCKQQQVIAQTSQALNLCAATIEFSGSTESVEGERHLLVATHRRQACLDEIQRLRIERALRPLGAPKEKGNLTVKEITLPLRQDYIRKLAADTISGHHLVCLLKYNEFVLATRTVPTLPGLLAVKFPDVLQMNNVFADFRVTVEIYGMTAQREILPHEVKYHINHKKTPKKKGNDNRLVMPPVQSPAGPNVVRTPALVQYGFAIFSLRETQRTSWSLTQVLGVSPLEGTIHMKVNCELSVSVEHKGFLTMFEDVSGFGAWHRRWCHLSGTVLNFWKYPDDEKKKTPMGSIDLYSCTTQKVTIAPRDICARLHTMLLECERPALETDQESLIIVPNGRTTTVRYLLSADTKEEREEWCAYFNKALTLLRAWGPPQ